MRQHPPSYFGSGLLLVAATIGCGNSDAPQAPDAGSNDNLQCELSAPLTCETTTLCSNSTVRAFHGQLPAPAGGRISVGAYRLGYVLYPTGKGADNSTAPADELTFGASDFLHVTADPTSALVGGLGSYTTGGASMTLSFTSGCGGNGTPLAAFGDCGPKGAVAMAAFSTTVGYTAEHDTIAIFRDAPGWPAMYVYYAMVDANGSSRGACESVASEPQTPGDSLACRASGFCSCIHHEAFGFHCSSSN